MQKECLERFAGTGCLSGTVSDPETADLGLGQHISWVVLGKPLKGTLITLIANPKIKGAPLTLSETPGTLQAGARNGVCRL